MSASLMNAGVASRGSPTPRSMISIPRSAAACLACVRRTNGYVPCAARSGLTGSSAIEPLQQLVAADERRDLDALVAAVRVGGIAGPEVHGVDAREDQLGDGRPRLLGEDLGALLAELLHEGVVDRHRAGRSVAVDDELAARVAERVQPVLGLLGGLPGRVAVVDLGDRLVGHDVQ